MRISNKFKPLFDPTVSEVVEPSGRNSGKTTANEIYAVSRMLADPRANIWVCRAESVDIRDKSFASYLNTINSLGLERFFKASLSPFKITCVNGATAYFDAINGKTEDDLTQTKGFTPRGGTLAVVMLDEADEVKSPNHIVGMETTAARFMLPDSKTIYAYNPPMGKAHWAHKFFADKVANGATKIYTTWEDIRGVLNAKTIAIIERFREQDPEYYRYWYLGEAISFKGAVYPQFSREKHIVNIYERLARGDRVTELILGLDEGSIYDSTCVSPLAIMASGVAVVLGCLEIDPVKTGAQAPSKQARELIEYQRRLLDNYAFLRFIPSRWIFESAEAGQNLMNQFIAETNGREECVPVRGKSIMGDIKRVRTMLEDGILLFHNDLNDPDGAEKLITDIENYFFDPKTGTVKKGQRDDTIDSLEYATKLYYDTPLLTNGY